MSHGITRKTHAPKYTACNILVLQTFPPAGILVILHLQCKSVTGCFEKWSPGTLKYQEEQIHSSPIHLNQMYFADFPFETVWSRVKLGKVMKGCFDYLQLILIFPRARENVWNMYIWWYDISYKYKVHRSSIERDGDLKVFGTYAYKQLGRGRPILCAPRPRYVPTKRSCQISCLSGQKTMTETSLKSLGIRQCRYSCQRCLSPALQHCVSWPDPDTCFNSVQVAINDKS